MADMIFAAESAFINVQLFLIVMFVEDIESLVIVGVSILRSCAPGLELQSNVHSKT